MNIQTRDLYRSSNGDDCILTREMDSGRVYVLHRANLSSGGRETRIEISDFLARGGSGPEHQELIRLIGTLCV